MKLRVRTWLATVAGLVIASMMVAVPSATAADPLSNPSGTWTVSCGGAKATIQIKWKSPSIINVWWKLEDTQSNGKSPVLRIHARNYRDDSSAYKFPGGDPYYIQSGGGSSSGRTFDWDPSGIGGINHLWVQVKDGTSSQGTACTKAKKIFNWTALAFKSATDRAGKPYELGAAGPDRYDCSGLVYASYNSVGNFPGWSVRASADMYRWVRNNTAESKFYAKQVSYSNAMAGDLIFYDFDHNGVADHVAFYAGNGRIFDAKQPGTVTGYRNEYGSRSRLGVYRILGAVTA
jgi:peptidoglycan DL-endopeptidase CwlO